MKMKISRAGNGWILKIPQERPLVFETETDFSTEKEEAEGYARLLWSLLEEMGLLVNSTNAWNVVVRVEPGEDTPEYKAFLEEEFYLEDLLKQRLQEAETIGNAAESPSGTY